MELITCKRNAQNRSLNISFPGDVLSTNAEGFRRQIFSVLDTSSGEKFPFEKVEVDLARAKMVDSVGLNLLVSILKMVKAQSGSMKFLVGSKSVERTFQFTRLNCQAEVIRTEA